MRHHLLVALVVCGLSLGSVRTANANVVTDSWDSLGCEFTGQAGVNYGTSSTWAHTWRASSCATYAMTAYDYYFSGQWYGTYYNYCYTSYTYVCSKSNWLGATQVYTYHQIYVSGAWQQIENLYASG